MTSLGLSGSSGLPAVGYRFFTGIADADPRRRGAAMTVIPPTLTSSPTGPAARAPDALRRSAEALESAFLAEMLKAAGVFKPSETMGGGAGEEQFTSFLADAQAQALVARGGIGLADSIEQALRVRAQGAQPDPLR